MRRKLKLDVNKMQCAFLLFNYLIEIVSVTSLTFNICAYAVSVLEANFFFFFDEDNIAKIFRNTDKY